MPLTRIAIAGLGAAARTIHLPAYRMLRSVEIVGGFDPGVGAACFPFPVFRSAEEMLEKTRPDIFAVVTPPDSHFSLTRLGLLAGCHVLCEKPFMPTIQEGVEVIELAQRVGRWVVVNNQYRFMNIHAAARQLVGSEKFGDLLFLRAEQTFCTTDHTEAGWRGRDRRRTCQEFGIHVLDLSRFFFGADPVAITARMPRPSQPDGPDYLNLIQLEFPGDRFAQITLDRLWRGSTNYLSIRLDGTAGGVQTHIGGVMELRAGIRGGSRRPYLTLDLARGGRADLYSGDRRRRIATDPLDLFAHATYRLLEAMLAALAAGVPPPCHAADNLRTLALMLAAYESADRRETVEMVYPYVPTGGPDVRCVGRTPRSE